MDPLKVHGSSKVVASSAGFRAQSSYHMHHDLAMVVALPQALPNTTLALPQSATRPA